MTIITDPLFYVLAVPAITALGLGKGGFAGVGMISTPLLALTVPPLQAAAILLPILLCQDAISVWAYRHRWSAWNLKVLLPGAVVGVGGAWLFAAYVPNAYVEIVVGVTGVCFALYNWFGKVPAQPRRPSVAAGMFWGSLAGFTSTIIQVGAPPYQVHILPQRLDKLTLIGTTIIFFALMNVMKLVPYFALGQFSPLTLATSCALAVRGRRQFSRPVACAAHADRAVLPDHVCADVFHLAGSDLAGRQRHSRGVTAS
jgi:uncharacterized membrane protein YfcA